MKNSSLRKGLVLIIIIIFIGATAFPSTVGTINEKKSFTSSKSRGYIQNMIDNASDGDTIFIPNDVYYENIIIDKSINLVGESLNTTIDGSGSGKVVSVVSDWVNISGFTITHGDIGIDVHSDHNHIFGNSIIENNEEGIFLTDSNYNEIWINDISENEDGIELEDSSYNEIDYNRISFNKDYGLEFHGSFGGDCKCNIIVESVIESNNIGIYLDLSSYNTIFSNTISSNLESGIHIFESSSNLIDSNYIDNNLLGIVVNISESNSILDNSIISNYEEGVFLFKSNNNVINHNIISKNEDGVELEESGYNRITNNTISLNSDYGLEFQGSAKKGYIQNMVDYNTFSSNIVGILLINSSFNLFTKNNFLNNSQNAFFNCCKNSWKQNYWDKPRIFPKLIFGKIKFGSILIPWINVDWRPAKEPYEDSGAEQASAVVKVNNSKIRITLTTGGDNMPSSGYFFENMVTIRLNGTALSENQLEGNIGWEVGESLYIGGNTPILDDDESAVGPLGPGDYAITVTIIETVIFDDVITII